MIHWNASPEIFSVGPLHLRWYGLLFASGFLISYHLGKRVFAKHQLPVTLVDQLLIYTVIGTVIGARLVHCLFYEPDYYLSSPLEILKVWEGGLASHGAILGLFVSAWVFSRRHAGIGFWWLVDLISVTGPVAGAFIRLGNLMNSEIYGKPTDVAWAFVFERLQEPPTGRHPTMLYEALVYFAFAALTWWLHSKSQWSKGRWRLGTRAAFGLMLVIIFSSRILLEFTKVPQESFDTGMPFNVGQLLSIPFVAFGMYCLVRSSTFGSRS